MVPDLLQGIILLVCDLTVCLSLSTADVDTGSSVSGTDFASRAVDIDPNDIESINILKGQAASALYGMRATNGVICHYDQKWKGSP